LLVIIVKIIGELFKLLDSWCVMLCDSAWGVYWDEDQERV